MPGLHAFATHREFPLKRLRKERSMHDCSFFSHPFGFVERETKRKQPKHVRGPASVTRTLLDRVVGSSGLSPTSAIQGNVSLCIGD